MPLDRPVVGAARPLPFPVRPRPGRTAPSQIAQIGTNTPATATRIQKSRSGLIRRKGIATAATRPITVTHEKMFHDAGIRSRKAVPAAATPIAASTPAALVSHRLALSASCWPQIWLTISVSLKPQSQ